MVDGTHKLIRLHSAVVGIFGVPLPERSTTRFVLPVGTDCLPVSRLLVVGHGGASAVGCEV